MIDPAAPDSPASDDDKPLKPKLSAADPSDTELLNLIQQERRASVGFEQDQDLSSQRETALDYYKGLMPDVPALPNRSKAISSDISDAVETLLPDLIEVFLGGDDVATFQPTGPQDEQAARQETDYVNHVVMQENNGFLLLYTVFKDALLTKTGVFKWEWETGDDDSREEVFEGLSPEEYQVAMAMAQQYQGQGLDLELSEVSESQDETGQPLISFKARYDPGRMGRVRIYAVPSEDFSVGRDTVDLKGATYCCMRSRERAQDLIARGYDEDDVYKLPPYATPSNSDAVKLARDTADEQTNSRAGIDSDPRLRQVEIIEHYLRVVGDDGEPKLWRVVSGDQERVLLEREEVGQIQFAAVTPYPQAHRFYGRSVADLLVEVQRIRTALTRMLLDSGYFALNQRLEVAMDQANQFTISDLLRNEPGVPVRSKSGGAVKTISSGGLDFDAAGALEYFATVAEARTGIVRNAQGLNPDTLHDTATGAAQLINAAQKRTRMIARIFAETGVKDLFLGVHAMIRTHGRRAQTVRLRNQWVDIDPTLWGERADMTIEIGIGSGGQQHELQAGQAALQVITQVIGLQGGLSGPFVTAQNAYNFLDRYFSRGLGIKSVDAILSDPSKAPPPDPSQQQPPAPDPKLVAAQNTLSLGMYKAQLEGQLEQQRMAMDAQLQREKMASHERTNFLSAFSRPVSIGGQVG